MYHYNLTADLFFNNHQFFFYLSVVISSLILGSFINMLCYRLPIILELESSSVMENQPNFSLFQPRSHCIHCKKSLSFLDLIPLFSYLLLKGKCRHCQAPIPFKYLWIELSILMISLFFALIFQSQLASLALVFFIAFCVAVIVLDSKYQVIPDEINYSLIWLGLFVNLFEVFCSLPYAVIGVIVGYGFLFCINLLYEQFSQKTGMGNGDFKLFAGFGAWFGVFSLSSILTFAACSTLLYALYLKQKNRYNFQQIRVLAIPFGPFLVLGSFIFVLLSQLKLGSFILL